MNKIIIKEEYAEIVINSKKHGIQKVIIDIEDVQKVKNINWCIRKQTRNKSFTYYVFTVNNKIYMQLHRYLMNCPNDMTIDHINHNTLDNRKCNLRICSHSINNKNRKTKASTGETNIYFENNKYRVRIQKNYKNIDYGRYNTLEEAIKVRNSIY